LERTSANASVGGLPVGIGGLVPGDEPVPVAASVEVVVTGAVEGVETTVPVALVVPAAPDGVSGPSEPPARSGAELMPVFMLLSSGESH
jgi:hypothetical protein